MIYALIAFHTDTIRQL